MACAWASFTGYFAAMTLSYIIGQRRNAIAYDMKAILKYVALFGIIYAISEFMPVENSLLKMAINTLLLIIYVAYFIKKDLPLKSMPVIGKFFK